MPASDTNRRLLLAIGALVLPSAGSALADTQDSGETGERARDIQTYCIPWVPEVQGACPVAHEMTLPEGLGGYQRVDPDAPGMFADGLWPSE